MRDGSAVTAPISASKDTTISFTANVEVKYDAAATVTWSVTGSTENKSTINSSTGVLTIGADEEDDAELIVTATSTFNTIKKATATVNVLGEHAPRVISVTVSSEDDQAWVYQNGTLQFYAEVEVENGAAQTVKWSLDGTYVNGTGINDDGLLTVALTETAGTITVKAASDVAGFETISNTMEITVLEVGSALPTEWEEIIMAHHPGAHRLSRTSFKTTTAWGGGGTVINDNAVTFIPNYVEAGLEFPDDIDLDHYEALFVAVKISDVHGGGKVSFHVCKGSESDDANTLQTLYPIDDNTTVFTAGDVYIFAVSGSQYTALKATDGFSLKNNAWNGGSFDSGYKLTFEAIMLLPVRNTTGLGESEDGESYFLDPTHFARNWGSISSAYDMVLFNNGAVDFAFPAGLDGEDYEKLVIDYTLISAPETGSLNLIVKANNHSGADLAYAGISRDANPAPIEINFEDKVATGIGIQTNTGSPNVPGFIVKFNSLTLVKKQILEPWGHNISITQASGGTLTAPANAEAEEIVTITVSNLTAGLKIGKLVITPPRLITTVTTNASYTFVMPAEDVTITVEYWPESAVYRGGALSFGFIAEDWVTDLNMSSNEVAGVDGGNVIKLGGAARDMWGIGMGINAVTDTAINWNTVDAVSFWVRASAEMKVESFRILDDGVYPVVDGRRVWYAGEGNDGLTIGSTEWQQIIVAIPSKGGTIPGRKNVFGVWIPQNEAVANKILYIDKIELLTAASRDYQIIIPSAAAVSPGASASAMSLLGVFQMQYNFDGKTASLFSNQFGDFAQWFTTSYNVGGNAALEGTTVTAEASGSFTLSVTLNKGLSDEKTSNDLTGTIATLASPIIDAFDYIPAGGLGVGNWSVLPALTALGYSFEQNGWWCGLFHDLPGAGTDRRRGAQNGGQWTPLRITRTNEVIDFSNDITSLVATHPNVEFGLYVRGPAKAGADNFDFELHTGQHLAAGSQHKVWKAPAVTALREIAAINGAAGETDTDGWKTITIPLSSFMNGTDAITSLEEIVITGWQIVGTGGNITMFISEIKLVPNP